MNAVCASAEICEALRLPNGLGAVSTWGRARIAARESLIACIRGWSVTLPTPVWKTIGFAPFCCGGKRSARRSDAAWLSVPGRSRLFDVLPPSVRIRNPTTTRRSTHAPRTTHRLRAANDPSRYRSCAKPSFGRGAGCQGPSRSCSKRQSRWSSGSLSLEERQERRRGTRAGARGSGGAPRPRSRRALRRSGARARTRRPARFGWSSSLVITKNGQRSSARRSIAGGSSSPGSTVNAAWRSSSTRLTVATDLRHIPVNLAGRPVRPIEPHLHLELVGSVRALGLVRLVDRLPSAHDLARVGPPRRGRVGGHERRDPVRDGERHVERGAAAHRGANYGRALDVEGVEHVERVPVEACTAGSGRPRRRSRGRRSGSRGSARPAAATAGPTSGGR